MNVLFVSAVFPYPLYSGGQVRIYNLLKRLGEKHKITLCTFIREESESKYAIELPFCSSIHNVFRGKAWQPKYILAAAAKSYPFLFCTYDNSQMRSLLRDKITENSIDLVHIEPGYVWPSIPPLSIPLVIGEHNIEHEVYRLYADSVSMPLIKPFLNVDIRKMQNWEDRVWNLSNRIAAVSDEDAAYISSRASTPLDIIPNGVDASVLHFNPRTRSPHESPVALFVGNFSWLQNRDALKYILDDIWPQVIQRIPGIKLRIVGRGAPSDLRKRILSTSAELEEHAENIVSEFHAADVLLAPIRIGGGTKFKILEAMACGLPVVTSALGFAGIHGKPNQEYFSAETPDQFATVIQRVLIDLPLRTKIQKNARMLVENDYNWDTIATALDKTWNTAREHYHATINDRHS